MDNLAIIKVAFKIFRTTKLVWVFGAILAFASIIELLQKYAKSNPLIELCLIPVFFAAIIWAIIAGNSLLYTVYQNTINNKVTFSQSWAYGKERFFRVIGVIILLCPALLLSFFLNILFTHAAPNSLFIRFLFSIISTILTFSISFGECAVIIDDLKVSKATWTGIRTTFIYLPRVLILSGISLIVQILFLILVTSILTSGFFHHSFGFPVSFDYSTYQNLKTDPIIGLANWVFDLFLFPIYSTVIAICYLKCVKRDPEPELQTQQPLK